MNRVVLVLASSVLLSISTSALADDAGITDASSASADASGGADAGDGATSDPCAPLDTCEDKSIGDGCTIGDGGAGFCAPSTPGAACSGISILCQSATADAGVVSTAGGTDSGVACSNDPICEIDASAGCGDGGAGVCTVTPCTNGGTMLSCAAASYGCDNKQANAPCTTGPGTAGFCLPVTIGDGSTDELECDVDVAEGSDCSVGNGSASSFAMIGCALIVGIAVMKRRRTH